MSLIWEAGQKRPVEEKDVIANVIPSGLAKQLSMKLKVISNKF